MPKWLVKQLMRAFLDKDRRLIRFLNDCWFRYHRQNSDG